MLNEFDNPKDRTENFRKHRTVMQDVSITDLVKAYECINTLVIRFMPDSKSRKELLDEFDDVRQSIADIINKLTTDERCPHCNSWLYMSDLPQYDYVCAKCDENF